MSLARYRLAFIFITCAPGCAQDIAGWFPIHPGDKWTYQNDSRDDNGNGAAHLAIHRWKTEETTIGSWTIPEGTLVARQVRVTEGTPRSLPVSPNTAYLIRGVCVYADIGWDPSTRQLTPDFRKGLDTDLSPDFCFPLTVHKTWGAPHGLPDWGVLRPEQAKDWQVAGIERQTFHITSISSYPGAGITVDIWFQKGVGIVREDSIHHGTIGEIRTRLLRFEPASPR